MLDREVDESFRDVRDVSVNEQKALFSRLDFPFGVFMELLEPVDRNLAIGPAFIGATVST